MTLQGGKTTTSGTKAKEPEDKNTQAIQRKIEDYQNFLKLQTTTDRENRKRFKIHEEEMSKLQSKLKDMISTKSVSLVKDPRSAMRLPTCSPPTFSGEIIDYIPCIRIWKATMGASYMEEVQLMQLKQSIPSRTSDLIGLNDIRSMGDFWKNMDEEYLDTHALSKSAITDIKSLDRSDSRFLQIMKVKLTNHSKNLDIYKMGHRITSDEMVREHWLPLLTERAKEDWLKNYKGVSTLAKI